MKNVTNPSSAKQEDNAFGASGRSGSSIISIVISVLNLLATIGMLSLIALSFLKEKRRSSVEDISLHSGGENSEGEKGKGKDDEGKSTETFRKKILNSGKMVTLEQFTVNLSTLGSVNSKYVRVNISLEVPNDDVEGEVNSKMPQVRNVIIDLFNSKRPTDLATVDGRDFLKEEIRTAINNFLVSGKINGVYFTNFSLSN